MRAGRARPLAHSFSFSNMARGRGRRWRLPGRAFLAWPPPREPRAGRGGGAGACVRAWLDAPGSRWPSRASAPRGQGRRVKPSEVGGCPRGASEHGPRGVRVAGTGRLAPRRAVIGIVSGTPPQVGWCARLSGPRAGLRSGEASRAGCEL